MKRLLLLGTLLAVMMITGCGFTPKLNGTGSTQVESLIEVWGQNYPAAKLNYEAVGSGLGVDRFIAQQDFDFACTEVPLTARQKEDAEKNGTKLVAIPLAFSAVVPSYNLPTISEPLVFSGPVLADIFLGKITSWDDKALKDLNPKVDLPKEPIKVIVRSDSSGTSQVWSEYLSQVSDKWKADRGTSSSPQWTKADNDKQKEVLSKFLAKAGTKGVVNALKNNAGSIGYVPLSAAKQAHLPVGLLKVKDKPVEANKESIEAALKIALQDKIPDDLMALKLVNQSGDKAYPIIDANWVIFFAKQKGEKGKQLVSFLRWATHEGQESIEDKDSLEKKSYVRIPAALNKPIDRILDETSATTK